MATTTLLPSTLSLTSPDLSTTIALALATWLVYHVGLAIYRLYLSPIAHFPGPKLAAISYWYEFYYDVVLRGKCVFKLAELHDQYGPIVRINPHELHVRDPDFYDVLYTARAGQRRDKWGWTTEQFANGQSMFTTPSHDVHRMRRAALNPFFSRQAVSRIEPMVRASIDRLCARFSRLQATGEPVEAEMAFAALTTDIITTYCFNTSYGCLDADDWTWSWPSAMAHATTSGHLSKHIRWLLPVLLSLPESLVARLNPAVMNIISFQRDLARQITTLTESSDHRTIFHELLLTDSLPASEKSLQRLVEEGQTMIAAGQLTTSTFLKVTTYHVLANPAIHAALKAELSAAIPDPAAVLPPLASLERLPYLRAVISEGLRTSHGVCGRLARISPDAPLLYNKHVIPVGTPVSMDAITQHTDPTIFPSPHTFDPDRWLGPDGGVALSRYLVPFGKGSRSCLGINLANAEMVLTLAAVFRRFDPVLVEGTTARDVEVAHDHFVPHGHADSKGVRIVFKVNK